jgi:hypothetical protein
MLSSDWVAGDIGGMPLSGFQPGKRGCRLGSGDRPWKSFDNFCPDRKSLVGPHLRNDTNLGQFVGSVHLRHGMLMTTIRQTYYTGLRQFGGPSRMLIAAQ